MSCKPPCSNDYCDKCDPRPRWKVSRRRLQWVTHEREIKATTEDEAREIYDQGTQYPHSYDDRGGVILELEPVLIEQLPASSFHLEECCYHDLNLDLVPITQELVDALLSDND